MTRPEPENLLSNGALFAGNADTIVAIATPPGRGALALIRVSGQNAHAIGKAIATRWPSTPRTATRSAIHDQEDALLDQAVVIRYDAPASYTGEDAFEITTHGGSVVPATIVAALIEQGARQALPGEFSRRAVLNGKLDLLQAEAAGDLVAATSRAAQRVALQQLDGGLSRRITELRSWLLTTEALLAYDIDFPEEDDGPLPADRILDTLAKSEQSLDDLLATTRAGELVRDGALVVFAGVPNAGKSSLFNALLGQQRAIVTDIPGTTRDAIEAVIDVGRWPLRLVDTAGLRDSTDPVEQLGVATSERYLAQAAVVLACGETEDDLRAAADRVATVPAPIILVGTKSDLALVSESALAAIARQHTAASSVLVSAERGTGLDALIDTIMCALDTVVDPPSVDAPLLTHARHRHIIGTARQELAAFRHAWREEGLPATVAAVHLRTAVAMLEELIGAVEIEQILDEVFRRFCVGK